MWFPETVLQSDLEQTVLGILASINIKVNSYNIASCHRLKRNKGRSCRNVIVRFINRKDVYKCLINRWKLKNSHYYKTEFNRIFIIENLCPKYKELFNKCYALFIQEKIVDVYTRNGQVFVVINDEDNPKKISNDTDFTKLITKFQK